jgi:transcriptional regulator with XRE-family HTH domain
VDCLRELLTPEPRQYGLGSQGFCKSNRIRHLAKEGSQIANRIKTLRESKGLTQGQLASAIGVDPQTVSRWERGERVPNGEDYAAAMEFLISGESGGLRIVAEEQPSYNKRMPSGAAGRVRRFELFMREMARMDADDFELDYVRERGKSYIESVLFAEGAPDLPIEELDRELDAYLNKILRVWVIDHMKGRGAKPRKIEE